MAIFVVSQEGLRPEDEERLISAARLDPFHEKALRNLEVLGIPMVKAVTESSRLSLSKKGKRLVSRNNTNESDSEYASSRFACELKGIILQMQGNKLSLDDFPSVLPMPVQEIESVGRSKMAMSARVSSSTAPSRFKRLGDSANGISVGGGAKLFGARQIVFITGGACYSELRSARDLMDTGGLETMLGCTHLVNPRDFVKGLASL